ncbi:MAG TPA: lysophospholipid acyltransferase family protein [Planctomycetota bacterium]|jgi:KDO2-lipid IV(A) lauroyltransferase|nr:lysophospholipid acyltransferase family protein [Planctomycetota bacterium]
MVRRARGGKHLLEYGAARAGIFLARRTPAVLAARALSGLLQLAGRRRIVRRSLEHLDLAFGDSIPAAERRRIVERMVGNLARAALESARFFEEGPGWIDGYLRADATRSRLEEAAARGRGVVGVTAHFGNYELIPAWLTSQGYRVGMVTARLKNPRLDAFVRAARARAKVEIFDQDDSPRGLLRILREGGIAGVVPDQDLDHLAGTFVPFFGRPAFTATGPSSLARLAGAPILPMFTTWTGEGYRISFEEPIDVPRTEDRTADLVEGTRAWTAVFERRIRERPDHWVWFHPRWKTSPERLRRRGRVHLLLEARPGG